MNSAAAFLKEVIRGAAGVCALALLARVAAADGVSAYLPLNLEPEIERQIERVLILADEPILKRPFAVALVQDALPQACKADKSLCMRVKRYLERYSRDYAVTHASVAGAVSHGANSILANNHGLPAHSKWDASVQAFIQPSDYFLASAGAIAYDGRTNPTGSMLSVGFNWLQLDIGYRDHWLSPATDSSMLLSTEAPTTPSLTVSNYEPLGRLGFQYEFFLSELSRSNHILYQGVERSGRPHLFGTQLSIEPFSGWSLGLNRMLEYGGERLPHSARFLLRDFFKPAGRSQSQGNQQASYISRFIFPGKTPFAAYFQYAGEDSSNGGSYLLGNAALTAGIDFPRLGRYFDLTYEMSEWQNLWYVHFIYRDGMTNDGLVLGHWGADQRVFGDGVGARSQMLRVGWEPPFGGYLEGRVRTLANQAYSPYIYHHYVDFMLRYSRPWNAVTVGGELLAGRDVFGDSFSRLSGFVRYGGDSRSRDASFGDDADRGESGVKGAELFVDVGINANRVTTDLEPGLPITKSSPRLGPHLGIGARRAISQRSDFGVRAELDQVDGHTLFGVRAFDFRLRYTESFAASAFVGVARYAVQTPAYSLYYGLGVQWRDVRPRWDLDIDLRHAQNVARDHLLPTDPPGSRPDTFYKIDTALLYVSRRF